MAAENGRELKPAVGSRGGEWGWDGGNQGDSQGQALCQQLALLQDKALTAGAHIRCQNPCSIETVESPHLLSETRPGCGKGPQAANRLWENKSCALLGENECLHPVNHWKSTDANEGAV